MFTDIGHYLKSGGQTSPELQRAYVEGTPFTDPRTGRPAILAASVRPLPGEDAQTALERTLRTAATGEGRLDRLLAPHGLQTRQFDNLVRHIRPEELEAITAEPAFAHLAQDPRALGLEWLSRISHTRPHLLEKSGTLPRLMVDVMQKAAEQSGGRLPPAEAASTDAQLVSQPLAADISEAPGQPQQAQAPVVQSANFPQSVPTQPPMLSHVSTEKPPVMDPNPSGPGEVPYKPTETTEELASKYGRNVLTKDHFSVKTQLGFGIPKGDLHKLSVASSLGEVLNRLANNSWIPETEAPTSLTSAAEMWDKGVQMLNTEAQSASERLNYALWKGTEAESHEAEAAYNRVMWNATNLLSLAQAYAHAADHYGKQDLSLTELRAWVNETIDQESYVIDDPALTSPSISPLDILPGIGASRGALNFGKVTAKKPPKLYWHGSDEAVVKRNAEGIFADGVGNGGALWTTNRKINELGPLDWRIGGNTNVKIFPPRFINKGGVKSTYTLTPKETELFKRAWGPDFNWNFYQWWKGAAGQYYHRPIPASWGQRFGELGKAAGMTGAGASSIPIYNYLKNDGPD